MAKAKAEKVTKADAVRAAVKEGITSNQEISDYAKQKFGLDVSLDQVSTYKSLDKKRGEKSEGKPKPAGEAVPAARPVKESSTVGNGSPAALALAVKKLVEQHGAEAVREMTKVFEG